ncbi:MAG: RraA family protein [Elstera sp.]
MISPDLLARLRATDTPTVCNALELLLGGRRATGFTRFPVVAADPGLPSMVGYARCVKIRAASPPTEPPETVLARRMAYYDYVAGGPAPSLVVIEDTDWPHCVGAFWGELHVAVHKGLGLGGTLTNGLLRDLGQLDPGYQVIAGAVGPSHAFVHVTDLDVPVTVLGLSIAPGDLVHADRHGATIIPETVLDGLAAAIDTVIAKEKIILDVARAPGFTVDVLKEAWGRMLKA